MADAGAGRARNIVFRITWPETEEGLPLLDPSTWPDCKYCVYQLEIGDDTHRLHYQGYMEFTGAKRFAWLHANCDGLESANFFIRRGSQDEAVNYAMKRETRVDGPWEWGLARPNEAGKRNDLIHTKRALDEGRSMAYMAENFFPTFLRYQRGLKEYKRLKMPRRDWPMELFFIIGPSGTGKSRWAKDNYPDAYWKDGTKWWDDYDGQETVVWDEYYSYCAPFNFLLRLIDRNPLRVETKGGYCEFTSRRIIFTSNQDPSEWYNAERTHQGPWATNPLHRRIREFGRVMRTGAVHVAHQAPHHWDGTDYVDLFPPPMRPAEVIDLDNPNQFQFE